MAGKTGNGIGNFLKGMLPTSAETHNPPHVRAGETIVGIGYKDAGVDIELANALVEKIKDPARTTFRHFPGEILSGIGPFSGVGRLKNGTIVASSTDGVGTKLKVAFRLNKHDTVGIDLVAMCVNDLIVMGIPPAFFLDYIAFGKLTAELHEALIRGIVIGCHLAECTLLGGETAEMPGMYEVGEYDMAGFACGFGFSDDAMITGENIRLGMGVYALPSSGLHSNGYSLARKVFNFNDDDPEQTLRTLNETIVESAAGKKVTLGEEMICPTVIYVQPVKEIMERYEVAGMANITGGGLIDNPPRPLPKGLAIKINKGSWPVPPIFRLIQEKGRVPEMEMLKTFNNGVGMIIISPDNIKEAIKIGEVIEGNGEVHFV